MKIIFKRSVYIAILNPYTFSPIFDPAVVVFHDSLTMERTVTNDLTLIIHRIYEEHINMIRNSFYVLDNYS